MLSSYIITWLHLLPPEVILVDMKLGPVQSGIGAGLGEEVVSPRQVLLNLE